MKAQLPRSITGYPVIFGISDSDLVVGVIDRLHALTVPAVGAFLLQFPKQEPCDYRKRDDFKAEPPEQIFLYFPRSLYDSG